MMNPRLKIVGLTTLFLFGLMTVHPRAIYSEVPFVQDCGCGISECTGGCGLARSRRCGCQKCNGKRMKRNCPKCDCEFCTLEVKQVEEEKTCFKTEQKIVCVPTVRMPWQNCCPGTSKTRTVNVLKTEKYKCPACEYTWSVHEPELTFSQPAGETTPPIVEPSQADQTYQPPVRALQPAIQNHPASIRANPASTQFDLRSIKTNQGLRLFPANPNSSHNNPYQAPTHPTYGTNGNSPR